jgi:hypothetical protein
MVHLQQASELMIAGIDSLIHLLIDSLKTVARSTIPRVAPMAQANGPFAKSQ